MWGPVLTRDRKLEGEWESAGTVDLSSALGRWGVYRDQMSCFVPPTRELWASWAESIVEFAGETPHGYGVTAADLPAVLSDVTVFEKWAAARATEATPGADLPEGRVPCTTLWIVDEGKVCGSLSVRHELNEFLLNEAGHVGYGVRPSARRRGLASDALRHGIDLLRGMGVDRALVTCDTDNLASRRVIEKAGGKLEHERAGILRFWITG